MSLKSILVAASGEGDDAQVIAAAAALAARVGGYVQVTPAFADPAADYVAYGAALAASGSAAARIAQSEHAAQERVEAIARDAAARERVTIEVSQRALQPPVALARAAVLADVVMFAAAAAQSQTLAPLFAETLLATRAPVLLTRAATVLSGPAAIAWDGSAQAGRAVRAALPLLALAPGVLIVRNVDDAGAADAAGDPERLRTYLAAHGVSDIAVRNVRGERVAASLLAAAQADNCALLIAGAYGRPRFYEMVLGGATRAFVNAAEGPSLLLAH